MVDIVFKAVVTYFKNQLLIIRTSKERNLALILDFLRENNAKYITLWSRHPINASGNVISGKKFIETYIGEYTPVPPTPTQFICHLSREYITYDVNYQQETITLIPFEVGETPESITFDELADEQKRKQFLGNARKQKARKVARRREDLLHHLELYGLKPRLTFKENTDIAAKEISYFRIEVSPKTTYYCIEYIDAGTQPTHKHMIHTTSDLNEILKIWSDPEKVCSLALNVIVGRCPRCNIINPFVPVRHLGGWTTFRVCRNCGITRGEVVKLLNLKWAYF